MKSKHLPHLLWQSSWLLLAIAVLTPLKTEAWTYSPYTRQIKENIRITGQVTDKNGTPLPGVTVMEKGTKNGVITDEMGHYQLSAADNAILVFNFIGMDPIEQPVGGRQKLDVILSSGSTTLNEVVTIGYGKQSRTTLTTSISKIGEQEFAHAPGQNPLLQLQGKVAGLTLQVSDGQPGSNPNIFLRGGTTTSPEGDAPLIIVDGLVSQGMRSISELNPASIESIQVLKDAASTAIYGARAANGIIIVKTKSGKSGKARVSFGYTYGIEKQAKRYDFSNARDYIYISRKNTQAYNTSNPAFFLTGGTYGMSTGNARNSKNTLEFLDTYVQNYGQQYVDQLLNKEGWQTMEDPVTGQQLIFKDTDFQDVTFQTGYKKQYDVSVSGGSDKATYYLGLGHLNQDGIVYGTFYKNYNALLNGSYKLSDKWSINTGISYQVRNSNAPNNYQYVLSRSLAMPATYRLYYEDGRPAPGEGVASFRSRLHEVYYKEKYTDMKVYRTTLQVSANWDMLPGLRFTPSFSWFTAEGKEGYFEAFNETNTKRNAAAGHNLNRRTQTDGTLMYEKNFGAHHIQALLGTSYMNDYDYNMSGTGYGAPTDNIPTLNATPKENQTVSTSESTEIMMSYFGRISYDLNSKYLFAASVRRDGSSRFAEGHRWGLFPGVSAGWNIHLEDFWSPLRQSLSQFKLRASWGQAGNNGDDELSIFNSQGQYKTGYNYNGNIGLLNTTLANRDLKWETTTSFDIGLDIGLFKDRISLLVDYYNKLTSDRLFDKPIDATTGFSSIKSNYGSIRNRGIEVEIAASPVRGKHFSWDLRFTFSYNKGIVVDLPANGVDKNRIGGNEVYDPGNKRYVGVGGFAEGESFGRRYAYKMTGVYATDADAANAPYDVEAKGRKKSGGDAIWKDVDGNGQIDYKDMVYMGNTRPDKQGAFVNTLHYKGLSLRFVVDYAMGHVIDNGFLARSLGSARNNNMTLIQASGNEIWKEQGDAGKKYPRYTVQSDVDYNFRNYLRNSNNIGNSGYSSNNSLFYNKGDYLAFREISLSYNWQADLLKKAGIQNVELFAGAFNIAYLTAYEGLMPEVYTGTDPGLYPRPRAYNFGIKASF